MIIFDDSGSMKDSYLGSSKFNLETDIVNRFVWTIPDMKLVVAMRKFGFDLRTSEKTTLVYGPVEYASAPFQEALRGIRYPNGPSPLDLALNAAVEDLSSTLVLGKIAVIIISDGEDMSVSPLVSAERLKGMYGDRICLYTIQVGNDSTGRMLLERIATTGGCGFYTQGDKLLSNIDVADYVEKVLLAKKPVQTAQQTRVPLPATPPAALEKTVTKEVSAPTAPPLSFKAEPVRIVLNVQFDTGKADIKSKYNSEIKKVADFMSKYPASMAVIEGHTDNVGKKVYNQRLSQRRAESVRKYLIEKFGIRRARIKAMGYGMDRPIASNKTAEGRQMNRRIIAVVETTAINQ
jgi:OOP family OmpA-OmpF porin